MSASDKIISAAIALLLMPVTLFSEGFIISKLWGWYVVPTFNIQGISIVTAIGISLLWGVISVKKKDYWPIVKDDEEELSDKIAQHFAPLLIYWVGFFGGWIILAFK